MQTVVALLHWPANFAALLALIGWLGFAFCVVAICAGAQAHDAKAGKKSAQRQGKGLRLVGGDHV